MAGGRDSGNSGIGGDSGNVMTVLSQYYRLTWTQVEVRKPRVLGCILVLIPGCNMLGDGNEGEAEQST